MTTQQRAGCGRLAWLTALDEQAAHALFQKLYLRVLDGFFARHADRFEWHRPRAGTIGFVRLKRESAAQFCAELLERTGVLLLPSTLIDHGDAHVRLGFGRRNMPEVLAILDAYLAATVTSTAS
nr:hypothetical protein [Caballeronia glebae]